MKAGRGEGMSNKDPPLPRIQENKINALQLRKYPSDAQLLSSTGHNSM